MVRTIPGGFFMDAPVLLEDCLDAPARQGDELAAARRISRRQLLSAAGFASALLGGRVLAKDAKPPSDIADVRRSPELRLVHRCTNGLTEEEVERVRALGYDGYLEYQLNHEAIDDSEVEEQVLRDYPTIQYDPIDLTQFDANRIYTDLINATLLRSIRSRRQLFQRMVQFWTDHFNIDLLKNPEVYLKGTDDREVIRAHALGYFPDMLWADAHGGAMLVYLDNHLNVRGRPNENYAREVMELHTLGVTGGYTEFDVVEVARCLTGWTIQARRLERDYYKFMFNPSQHDLGVKYVLGNTIYNPSDPIRDGEEVLDILAAHPSTARFIAKKMSRWLWGYNPPEDLIDEVAGVYTATGGDIRAMIRVILRRDWIEKAPLKYKRPYHLVVSELRGVRAQLYGLRHVWGVQLQEAGQIPYLWSPPDGYPDTYEHWVGLLLPRWNSSFSLLNGETGNPVPVEELIGDAVTTSEVIQRINEVLFGGEMSIKERQLLADYLDPSPPRPDRIREAFALAMAGPGYQWY
jgi:hypothetical protein